MAISCPLNAPAPILIRASAFMVVLALTCSCSRPTPALTETPAQWRDPHSLKPQPSRLSVLSPEQKVRIEKLQAVLAEVDNSDVAKWEDDFERDRDPERELRSWESIAEAYQAYCSTQSLTKAQKADVLNLLLVRSTTADELEALRRASAPTLTPTQAVNVMRAFKGATAPIEVEGK